MWGVHRPRRTLLEIRDDISDKLEETAQIIKTVEAFLLLLLLLAFAPPSAVTLGLNSVLHLPFSNPIARRQLDRPGTACIDFNRKTSHPEPPSACKSTSQGGRAGHFFSPIFGSFKTILFPSLPTRHPNSTVRWCSNQLLLVFFIPSRTHS